MAIGFNRYNTEADVQKASLIDMTKDVFAPGPDGRVAVRMIHEGEYLGGPVANTTELNAISNPIVGEFHFVVSENTWGVWSGSKWVLVGGTGPDKVIAGDAIELKENGTVKQSVEGGEMLVSVKYDPAKAIELSGGKLAVKADNDTIIINANGKLEAKLDQTRTFYPVKTTYDTLGRPTQYEYKIETTAVLVNITYDMNGLRATIAESTSGVYSAASKTYNYNTTLRKGTTT